MRLRKLRFSSGEEEAHKQSKKSLFTWGGRMSKTALKQITVLQAETSNHWEPRWYFPSPLEDTFSLWGLLERKHLRNCQSRDLQLLEKQWQFWLCFLCHLLTACLLSLPLFLYTVLSLWVIHTSIWPFLQYFFVTFLLHLKVSPFPKDLTTFVTISLFPACFFPPCHYFLSCQRKSLVPTLPGSFLWCSPSHFLKSSNVMYLPE